MNPKIQSIIAAIEAVRVQAQPEEYDIHLQIAKALAQAGIDAQHEYKLGPRCRIDFWVDCIGREIKKGRPSAAALRTQLTRYLSFDALEAVIVITQQAVFLPKQISGKPVYEVSLNRLWGVALP